MIKLFCDGCCVCLLLCVSPVVYAICNLTTEGNAKLFIGELRSPKEGLKTIKTKFRDVKSWSCCLEREVLNYMGTIRVCCYLEKWSSGGIESFLFNMITHLGKNYSIDIVTPSLEHSIFTEALQKDGVNFFDLHGKPNHFVLNSSLFDEHLKHHNYDVLHVNAYQSLSMHVLKVGKKHSIPVRIIHSHNAGLRNSRTRFLKLALNNIGKRFFSCYATSFLTCSEAAAMFLFPKQVISSKQYVFVPNGIDMARFRYNKAIRSCVRDRLGLTDKFVIGNVGRLCNQKNQSMLIAILGKVSEIIPSACLLLVGDGEDRDTLYRAAKESGINERVVFFGESNKVEDLLWAMDVFAMPSFFEGLPVSLIEAQASGLPCLISDSIDRECAISENVTFIPIEKEDEWINRIVMAYKRKEARENAVLNNKYSIDETIGIIESIYAEEN